PRYHPVVMTPMGIKRMAPPNPAREYRTGVSDLATGREARRSGSGPRLVEAILNGFAEPHHDQFGITMINRRRAERGTQYG
ncbi:hypothetical protein CYQ47_16460, partial [Enterococcus faecalis]